MNCNQCGADTIQDGVWPGGICLMCWEAETGDAWCEMLRCVGQAGE